MSSTLDETQMVEEQDTHAYEEPPELQSPPPGTILTEQDMMRMRHADLEGVQKVLAGGSRHYLCEQNFDLQQELEVDIGFFSRTEAFIDANGNRCSVPANGPLALLLSGIDARIYDLPALEAVCSTAFVIPSGKMFISANFFKQIKKSPHPEVSLNFLLRHEMQHIFRAHFNRFKNTPYTHEDMNIAEDIIINTDQLKGMAVDGALVSMSAAPPAVFDVENDPLCRSRYEMTLKKNREALLAGPLRGGWAIDEASFKEFESFQTEEEVAEYLYKKDNKPQLDGESTPKDLLIAMMKGLSQDVIAMGQYPTSHPLLQQNAPTIAGYVDHLVNTIEAGKTVKRKDILSAMGGLFPLQGSDELVQRNLEHNLSTVLTPSGKPTVVNTGIAAIDELPPSQRLAETIEFLSNAYNMKPSNKPQNSSDGDSIKIESDQQGDAAAEEEANQQAAENAKKNKNEIDNLDEAEAKMNEKAAQEQNQKNTEGQASGNESQDGQSQDGAQDKPSQDGQSQDGSSQDGPAQDGRSQAGAEQQDANAQKQQSANGASSRKSQGRSQGSADQQGKQQSGQGQAGQQNELDESQAQGKKQSQGGSDSGSDSDSGADGENNSLEDEVDITQAISKSIGKHNSNERHEMSEEEFRNIIERDTSLAKDRAEIIKKGLGIDDVSEAARENRQAHVKNQIALTIDQAHSEMSKSTFAQPGGHQVDASYKAIAAFSRPVIDLKTVLKSLMRSRKSNTIRQDYNKQHTMEFSRQHALIRAGKQEKPFFTPGIKRLEEKEQVIAILIDSSGSVDDDMLKDFVSNAVGISRLNKKVEIVVVMGDTIGRGKPVVLTHKSAAALEEMIVGGRGGTDLTAMIQDTCSMFSIKENGPFAKKELSAMVYFTDGGDAAPSAADLKLAASKHLKSGKMPPLIWAIPQEAASGSWTTEFIKNASVYSAVYTYNAAELRAANEQMKIDIRSVPDTAQRIATLTQGNESVKPKKPKP